VAGNADKEFSRPALVATVGTVIGLVIGPSAIIAPPLGLFMIPVAAHFGFGRVGFPLLMLMVTVFAGAFSPLAGRAMDRFGVRKVIIPALILSGFAQIALSFTSGSRTAYIAMMAIVGILAGIQNAVAYTKVMAQWFRKHRGLMVGLAVAVGNGGGGILVPQIAEHLIRTGGWRLGYAGLGLFILIGSPLVIWLVREPTSRRPDHEDTAEPVALVGHTLVQAARSRPFWTIILALMAASGSLVALTIHVPAWIGDAGGSTRAAAAFLSMFALGGMVGQLGSGYLLDRVHHARIGAPFFLAASTGTALLLSLAPGSAWLPLDGLVVGMALGAEFGLGSYYISRFFGLRAYGQIYGCTYGAMLLASGAGPVVMGLGYESTHSYQHSFLAAAVALLASFLLILSLPAYNYYVNGKSSREVDFR